MLVSDATTTSPPPRASRPRARRLALAPLALVAACATAGLPKVTDADVARVRLASPEVTRAGLERGRALYQARCSACHEPYLPSTRDAVAWQGVVAEMAPRARLDDHERALVTRYLEAFAHPFVAPAPAARAPTPAP